MILDTAVIQYKDGIKTPQQIYDQYRKSLRMFDPAETTTPIAARDIYFYIPVPGSNRGHSIVKNINRVLATDPVMVGGARTNVFSRMSDLVDFVN